jgi:ribonuclease P protein component
MLPSGHRLRREKDIKTLFAKGKGVFDAATSLKWRKTEEKTSRFAITVGTKVAKSAVLRNRIRRQLRSMISERTDQLAPGYDVVIIVRPPAVGMKRDELERHLVSALKKTPILK